ncbi:hypothetical protein K413DRAFT_0136 [Clostridium sp. ASBs410]|nr:hypothetical protein K413DRAFT_0136 [Clostridium sp. ASBs410]
MKNRKNEVWSVVRYHKVYGQALGRMAIFNYIRFIGLEDLLSMPEEPEERED